MIKTVFLDMDGVIASFRMGVSIAFQQPYNYNSATWNLWEDWDGNITREDVNAKCDVDFWKNLPWMHDGLGIFEAVRNKFKPEQIYILTNPIVGGAGTATGKMLWIKKHLPGFYDRVIITQASKGLLAKPNILLIDDNDKYIDEFYAAGGRACLVPRPWNRNHFCADRTVEVVEKFLKDLK